MTKEKMITAVYLVVRVDVEHDAGLSYDEVVNELQAEMDYSISLDDSDGMSVESTEICGTTEGF
jgi:hypothetical protein